MGNLGYKELKWTDVRKALKKTFMMSSSIMIIGGFTMIFTWILAVEQVPATIGSFLVGSHIPAWMVFLFLDIIILILGTFLDVTPCILLISPILLPVMQQFGMSELQFGAIVIVGLAIGLVTSAGGHVPECGEQDLQYGHRLSIQIGRTIHTVQCHSFGMYNLHTCTEPVAAFVDLEASAVLNG